MARAFDETGVNPLRDIPFCIRIEINEWLYDATYELRYTFAYPGDRDWEFRQYISLRAFSDARDTAGFLRALVFEARAWWFDKLITMQQAAFDRARSALTTATLQHARDVMEQSPALREDGEPARELSTYTEMDIGGMTFDDIDAWIKSNVDESWRRNDDERDVSNDEA